MDARRNPNVGQEDIFARSNYGQQPRQAGLSFDFPLPSVNPNETILVQGYMCAYGGSGDCYPSDKDNPPSCAAAVRIGPGHLPSCQPVFTWTGGNGPNPVICTAECR